MRAVWQSTAGVVRHVVYDLVATLKSTPLVRLARITAVFVLAAILVAAGSRALSDLYLAEKTETEHFILLWTKNEARFFNCLPASVEENYSRISNDLNSEVSGKITIKVYDNSWVYNLSVGNPFPWPKLRAAGNADYQRRTVDLLLPPLDDSVYKEKELMQLLCLTGSGHEIAHILISEINPRFIRGWWHEGIAEFEHWIPVNDHAEFIELKASNEIVIRNRLKAGNIPTFEELSTRNFNSFRRINGYEFSKEFVKFAVGEYGHEVLSRMVKYPDDYDKAFGVSKDTVWQRWMQYLITNYSGV